MKRKQICALSAISTAVISAFAVSVASAQEVTALEQTEPVKVTASRVEQELMDVNMSVSVITEDQIRHSNARNIGELLETIPGVRIQNDGSQGMKRVSIRGENAFRTLILIDGQKVAEHKSMSGAPMLIDPAMVERVEVIKGPASVLYGSDAIGGVINIITKKGGNKPVQGEVSAGMNTSSSGKSAAASIYGGKNGWNYRLSAAIEDNGNLETPKGEMPNTYFRSKNVGGFLSYDITPDATVGGTLDYYDLEFGSTAYGMPDFAVDVPKWNRTKSAVFTEVKNISQVFKRLRADAYYQRSNKSMINTVGGVWTQGAVNGFLAEGFTEPALNMFGVKVGNSFVMKPYADNTLDQYGFSLQTDFQLGDKNYLIAGYEVSYDDLNAHSWNLGSNVLPMMLTDKNYDGYQLTNAIFASMESSLPGDFTLNYGARYTWVKTDMDMTNNKYPERSSSGNSSDGKAVFNAGLLWHGVTNLTLRANFSQGYRSPILQELYVDTSMGQSSSITYANPNLKPETSNNFEVGARWNTARLTTDFAIFYSDADDYIATLYNVSKKAYQYTNVASAKTFGAELTAAYKILETGFEPYASLTWIRRQFDDGQGFKTFDSATPELMARYGVRWNGEYQGLGLRSDLYARSYSKTKYKESTGESNYNLAGYTTLNLTGGVSFGPQKQYSLDVGLYNIFDIAYREQTAIYEPGRYAAVKLNARF